MTTSRYVRNEWELSFGLCDAQCGSLLNCLSLFELFQELIRSTFGAELCATASNPGPAASDCVHAYDDTYQGRTDLSKEVVVGEPVKKSPLHWSVPYNVQDKAGNAAATVWRDVHVEEVSLDELEAKVRDEMLAERRKDIDRAVSIALDEDRRKRSKTQPAHASDASACPKCDCPKGGADFDSSQCDEICKSRQGTCSRVDESHMTRLLLWLESFVPPNMAPGVLALVLIVALWEVLQVLWAVLFSSTSTRKSNWYANDERDRAMQSAVTYYHGANEDPPTFLPPRTSMAVGGGAASSTTAPGEGLFSPRSGSSTSPFAPPGTNGVGAAAPHNPPSDFDSIYASSPIISPSARGDGVRRRPPPYHLR
jgi:hypothetical protein